MTFSFKEVIMIMIVSYVVSGAIMEKQIKKSLLKNNKVEFVFLQDIGVDNAREITYERIEKEVK